MLQHQQQQDHGLQLIDIPTQTGDNCSHSETSSSNNNNSMECSAPASPGEIEYTEYTHPHNISITTHPYRYARSWIGPVNFDTVYNPIIHEETDV